MRKVFGGVFLLSSLVCFTSGAYAQVEQVTSMTVSNPAAMVANIEHYLASGEAEAQSVTLLRHMHDGADPSTHTVVAIFDDLKTLEGSMNRRAQSAAWAAARRGAAAVTKANSSLLAIQRKTWGNDSWQEGDYLAAVLVNSRNGAAWIDATDEMNRTTDVENPGMMRIVRLRGGPAGYAVLIVSPTYAGLIEYMESLEVSDEFATMRDKSETSVVGSVFYQVAKVWNP